MAKNHTVSFDEMHDFIMNHEVLMASGPAKNGKRKRLVCVANVYSIYLGDSLGSYYSTTSLSHAVFNYNEL